MIHLPIGLAGFPTIHDYLKIDDERPGSPFCWLQAVDRPELAFVAIDPRRFYPDFPQDVVTRAALFSGLDAQEPLELYVLCTVPPQPAPVTANFVAPIGVGARSRLGAQVVLHDSRFGSSQIILNP